MQTYLAISLYSPLIVFKICEQSIICNYKIIQILTMTDQIISIPKAISANEVGLEASNPALSKKPRKRRPSPSMVSKLTGIEISTAPNKSFLKKRFKEEPKIDANKPQMSILYDDELENQPTSTWVTSRIPYDIDNADDDIFNEFNEKLETKYYDDPAKNNDLNTAMPYSSKSDNDCATNTKPKTTRHNRIKDIANQWSSLITQKESKWKSEKSLDMDKAPNNHSDFYDEYGDKKQLNVKHNHQNHRRFDSNHHHQRRRQKYKSTDREDDYSKDGGATKRLKLHLLNTSAQTTEIELQDADTQTNVDHHDADMIKLGSVSSYQNASKCLKNQALNINNSSEKILVLFEASINSLLECCALERTCTDMATVSKKFNETLNFTKSNGVFISKHLSIKQEIPFWDILSALNIQMGAYIYNKLYILRRTEVSGAKSSIDNFFMKNSSSPSSNSSPTPNEINKDLRAKEAISEKMLGCFQFYATHMEHLAKWHSYVHRANNIIKQNPSVSEFFRSLCLLNKETSCEGDIKQFFNYIENAYQKIKSFIQ